MIVRLQRTFLKLLTLPLCYMSVFFVRRHYYDVNFVSRTDFTWKMAMPHKFPQGCYFNLCCILCNDLYETPLTTTLLTSWNCYDILFISTDNNLGQSETIFNFNDVPSFIRYVGVISIHHRSSIHMTSLDHFFMLKRAHT